MSNAIEISGLTKTFGRTVALDDLNLVVPTGQIHGFLGPNGAGKSTTLRVLLGLLRADSGTARLLGGDPWMDAPSLHRRLGYVPGDVNLWPNLSGGEAIDLLGRARGGLDTSRRKDLVERFDLDTRKKGRNYSKGNRQKVSLIAALSSNVELLLLDEPTSGLDPLMERVFADVIRAEQTAGRTVLLSSHILSEVEALCDHVSIIKSGKVVETGSLEQMRHLQRMKVSATMLRHVHIDFDSIPGVHGSAVDGRRVTMQVDANRMDDVVAALSAAGIETLTSTPPTLDELFVRHYESAV